MGDTGRMAAVADDQFGAPLKQIIYENTYRLPEEYGHVSHQTAAISSNWEQRNRIPMARLSRCA